MRSGRSTGLHICLGLGGPGVTEDAGQLGQPGSQLIGHRRYGCLAAPASSWAKAVVATQDQEQQLEGGLVGGEVTLGRDGAAKL